jgi:hypothetical protein
MKSMSILLAGVIALAAIPAGAQTLRFGHANAPGEIAYDMFNELAENVKTRTKGAVTLRIFPSEQLGKEEGFSQIIVDPQGICPDDRFFILQMRKQYKRNILGSRALGQCIFEHEPVNFGHHQFRNNQVKAFCCDLA